MCAPTAPERTPQPCGAEALQPRRVPPPRATLAAAMTETDRLEHFLTALLPLLRRHGARTAYVFGSHARGTADEHSDIDVIVVAPSERPCVDRFQDYLPAILEVGGRVDLFVYTPEEFEAMRDQERPFLIHALDGAKVVYEG